MKIRTITSFYHPLSSGSNAMLENLSSMTRAACQRYTDIGTEVQTTRLATPPFPHLLPSLNTSEVVSFSREMETKAAEKSFTYLSLGPALPEFPASYSLVPEILAHTKNVFITGVMARGNRIFRSALSACARIIEKTAFITSDGFTNLHFSALANVGPFCPFFPAAYGEGEASGFSIAMECADAVVEAFSSASSLDEARNNLLASLESEGKKLETIAMGLEKDFHLHFYGFDFSPAPFPDDRISLGAGMEALGIGHLGDAGSVAVAAFLADALDSGNWRRAGFNGLMLPILEDSRLALRSMDGTLSIKDLLLFSCMCGTGLDTVPLPGDISAPEIEGLLLDVAAISTRLQKPLTARLMPVPGLGSGSPTTFDFSFFSNGAAMPLQASPIRSPLRNDGDMLVSPRKHLS